MNTTSPRGSPACDPRPERPTCPWPWTRNHVLSWVDWMQSLQCNFTLASARASGCATRNLTSSMASAGMEKADRIDATISSLKTSS
eukprot:58932-Lingulodinium_polyedra.AAC.1